MRLSAQEEYGLRCLVQVAMKDRVGESAQIPSIAAAEGMSPEYVGKLMRVLRQGGLLVSTRGASGGYRLARPGEEITLMQIIEVLDGPLFADSFCSNHAGGTRSGAGAGANASCVHSPAACSIRFLWRWVGTALDKVLTQITLADLVAGPSSVSTAIHQVPSPLTREISS